MLLAAKEIKRLDWVSDARLYKIEAGWLAGYVIVSAVVAEDTGRPETYIFRSDENGNLHNWIDVSPGSFRGYLDHERALREEGYRAVKVEP